MKEKPKSTIKTIKVKPKTKVKKPKPKVIPENMVEEIVIQKPQKNGSKVFKGFFPLLAFSFVTSIISLFMVYYINNASIVYFFSGFNDYISIDSGLIALNLKSNSFEGNNIQYINKNDVIATSYEIGYYLKENNIDTPIITISGYEERGISIKKVVEEIFRYNFIEQAGVGDYLPDEAIELLKENKLFFIIKYSTTTNGKITDNSIELHLNLLNTKR